MNRKFYGNQYIGKTWRTFKLIAVGTWIAIKEMFHNPGKVLLAVLMLGLSTATTVQTSTPHRLWISEALADLTTDEEVKYVREVVEAPESTAAVMQRVWQCESGGKHFKADGTLVINKNKNGSIDVGIGQINREIWEVRAANLGY